MPNWSRALEEVGTGLLRQQELGGVMYTQAAQAEAARASGLAKQQESQQEALLKRAELASTNLENVYKEITENPPIWNEEEGKFDGMLWDFGIKAQETADAAWREVYRSRGMKFPEAPEMDWTEIASNFTNEKTGPWKGAALKDMVVSFQQGEDDKSYKESKTTVKEVIDETFLQLGKEQKSKLVDTIIDGLAAKDPDAIELVSRAGGGIFGQEAFTGRGIASSLLGFLPEASQFIAEAPGMAYGLSRSAWGGTPYEKPYELGTVPLGYQDWRSLFGISGAQSGGWLPDNSQQQGLISQGEERTDMSPEAVKARMANARR